MQRGVERLANAVQVTLGPKVSSRGTNSMRPAPVVSGISLWANGSVQMRAQLWRLSCCIMAMEVAMRLQHKDSGVGALHPSHAMLQNICRAAT